jgi:hypothetical protein
MVEEHEHRDHGRRCDRPPYFVRPIEEKIEGQEHRPRHGRDPGQETPASRLQPPSWEQQQEEGREGKRHRPPQQVGDRPGSRQRSRLHHKRVGGVRLPEQLKGEAEPEPEPSVGVVGTA